MLREEPFTTTCRLLARKELLLKVGLGNGTCMMYGWWTLRVGTGNDRQGTDHLALGDSLRYEQCTQPKFAHRIPLVCIQSKFTPTCSFCVGDWPHLRPAVGGDDVLMVEELAVRLTCRSSAGVHIICWMWLSTGGGGYVKVISCCCWSRAQGEGPHVTPALLCCSCVGPHYLVLSCTSAVVLSFMFVGISD